MASLVVRPQRAVPRSGSVPTGRSPGSNSYAKGATGHLDGETAWYEALMSGVGRLATTGDGSIILISCFTHGVQRHNLEGKSEGAYHLGGSACQAVPGLRRPDHCCGHVGRGSGRAERDRQRPLADHPRPHPALCLETDALGRYLIHGQATGEIVRLDLQPNGGPNGSTAPRACDDGRGGSEPWTSSPGPGHSPGPRDGVGPECRLVGGPGRARGSGRVCRCGRHRSTRPGLAS